MIGIICNKLSPLIQIFNICLLMQSSFIECTICLENKLYSSALPCGHVFHKECIKRLAKLTCPNCRQSFNFNQVLQLHISVLNNELEEDQDCKLKDAIFENKNLKVYNDELTECVKDLELKKSLMEEKLTTNTALLSHLKRQIKGYIEMSNQLKKQQENKTLLENKIQSLEKYIQVSEECPKSLLNFYKNSNFEKMSMEQCLSYLYEYKISNIALTDRIIKINRLHEDQIQNFKEKIIQLKSYLQKYKMHSKNKLKRNSSDFGTSAKTNIAENGREFVLPNDSNSLDCNMSPENVRLKKSQSDSPNFNRSKLSRIFDSEMAIKFSQNSAPLLTSKCPQPKLETVAQFILSNDSDDYSSEKDFHVEPSRHDNIFSKSQHSIPQGHKGVCFPRKMSVGNSQLQYSNLNNRLSIHKSRKHAPSTTFGWSFK